MVRSDWCRVSVVDQAYNMECDGRETEEDAFLLPISNAARRSSNFLVSTKVAEGWQDPFTLIPMHPHFKMWKVKLLFHTRLCGY